MSLCLSAVWLTLGTLIIQTKLIVPLLLFPSMSVGGCPRTKIGPTVQEGALAAGKPTLLDQRSSSRRELTISECISSLQICFRQTVLKISSSQRLVQRRSVCCLVFYSRSLPLLSLFLHLFRTVNGLVAVYFGFVT